MFDFKGLDALDLDGLDGLLPALTDLDEDVDRALGALAAGGDDEADEAGLEAALRSIEDGQFDLDSLVLPPGRGRHSTHSLLPRTP